jgi:hypothetical protein
MVDADRRGSFLTATIENCCSTPLPVKDFCPINFNSSLYLLLQAA